MTSFPMDKFIERHSEEKPKRQKLPALCTEELKKEAYKQYCDHLAKGKSKRSWVFEHRDVIFTGRNMDKLVAQDKESFPEIYQEAAMAKGLALWEEVADKFARGEMPEVPPAGLQMVMRNKYGWDKDERRINPDMLDDANRERQELLMRQISEAQSQLQKLQQKTME